MDEDEDSAELTEADTGELGQPLITPKEFKRAARKAIRSLPDPFREHVAQIEILYQRRVGKKLRRELELADDETIFGLYDGPNLLERFDDPTPYPARITLFYEPHVEECETIEELIHELQVTILHEIGHHFGLEEEDLARLGYE